MKALTLWQPWASAIAVGAKRIETRSWPTRYRGPLAIHAARRRNVDELIYLGACWGWDAALRPLGYRMGRAPHLLELLPFGAIVATCVLIDCRPTDSFTQADLDRVRHQPGEDPKLHGWTEREMGNFTLGRWGWVIGDVQRLDPPASCKGTQGLWDWPGAAA